MAYFDHRRDLCLLRFHVKVPFNMNGYDSCSSSRLKQRANKEPGNTTKAWISWLNIESSISPKLKIVQILHLTNYPTNLRVRIFPSGMFKDKSKPVV